VPFTEDEDDGPLPEDEIDDGSGAYSGTVHLLIMHKVIMHN
jgi:hypothetical protein